MKQISSAPRDAYRGAADGRAVSFGPRTSRGYMERAEPYRYPARSVAVATLDLCQLSLVAGDLLEVFGGEAGVDAVAQEPSIVCNALA